LASDEAEDLRKDIVESASRRGRLPEISLNAALSKLNVPTHEDIKALESQVEKLMQSVDKLLAISAESEEKK
jgi:polyhydroxyalkanoate synthesis regulator phasin